MGVEYGNVVMYNKSGATGRAVYGCVGGWKATPVRWGMGGDTGTVDIDMSRGREGHGGSVQQVLTWCGI